MISKRHVARAAALISASFIIESAAHEGKNRHTTQESIDIDHSRAVDHGNTPLAGQELKNKLTNNLNFLVLPEYAIFERI